ncbi:bleomycin resistance protein [Taibaiella chishuiensis]|uniref:Bleomycin resistance protein n=1 Tax=Taibaiella chishuiensis TaxID=1434707 RepID=A0A2P8CXW6_9BACT|nr:VOC family protein [Taibaiella chishuiensis]PSK89803.1 catechol 2,3-dioxygenase-like lactoylglutathione lyase family enzyme [Taibaiella chishuiensis]
MLQTVHPKLPMRDKAATLAFYRDRLGFNEVGPNSYEGYLMLEREGVQLHFFGFKALDPAENYGQVYIRTDDIEKIYRELSEQNIVHPAGHLHTKPWGQRECAALDPDNNLLTFGQSM